MANVPLAERLATDVHGAFAEFVAEYQDDVFSALLRMTNSRPDAEDLAQEAFVRAFRALEGYDRARIRGLTLRSWLMTIAMNTGRNHFRDAGRRPRTAPFTASTEASSAEQVTGLDVAEWSARLAALGEGTRAAIVMRHVVGLTTAETADALGVPEGTVKARVARGLDQLRQQLTTQSKRAAHG
jgi:RNA polymerase sigma-70 factor (ECF subfamily)